MPQVKLASKSLNKDISHAWKLLNQLADTLTRISTDTATLPDAGTSGARAGKLTAKTARKASSRSAAQGLPDTTGDFFAKHLGKRKKTASQIHQSVLDSLDFTPSKDQAAILRNRLVVWLSNAVKSESNRVGSVGSGRERLYYKE